MMSAIPDDDGRTPGRRKALRNPASSFPKEEPRPAAPATASFSLVDRQILSVCLRSRHDGGDIGILPALLSVERRARRSRPLPPP